jgi:GTP-binding protein
MAFLDNTVLQISAGKGGDGVVRWRRESGIPMGGPWGGDGGDGGDVYVQGIRNMHTLHNYRHQKEFSAEDGGNGGTKLMAGKNGEDLILQFPLGTVLYIQEIDKEIDLVTEDEKILLFKGGAGGLGNDHFKSSTNQAPEQCTLGKIGEFGTVSVELRLIADAGLIGFPNAGKSSLLNSLTKSKSKVGDYNFTTLEPHLGDWYGYILADIPGIIEGASEGRGLGIKFLQHIQRTKLLIHLIESTSESFLTDYKVIRKELETFNSELTFKKEIVVISKIDMLDFSDTKKEKDFNKNLQELEDFLGKKVIQLSLFQDESIKEFEKVLKENL